MLTPNQVESTVRSSAKWLRLEDPKVKRISDAPD